ncbi:hypothetical protein FPV67DRAFT_1568900 [Lyophyllum atratum]|nr:hypothetical protein FPV67DRAFT_1568900 [Lyophyllum atratum]
MNNDAQEAAMGLLSLSPSNLPPPPPLVPLKRKHPPTSTGSTSAKRRPTTKLVQPQQPQQQTLTQDGDVSTEAISCICGSTFDDGFSIACDDCSRWCHAACFDIVSGEVPEEWRCWECVPRPVDRERAVRLQKERQGLRALEEQQVASTTQAPSQPQLSHQPQRRRTSPGLERKHRRTSAPAIDGSNTSKRKRRASFVVPPPPPPAAEEDADVVVDIDEPWSHSYVHIQNDIVPARETREKLLRHAQSWRGITAVAPFPPPSSPPVAVHPLPDPDPVRPPAYVVHTTAPVQCEGLIAPFTSTITPSSTYLSDPLNAYAHLGLPKPFVHLIGPPLDLALDARIAGDGARYVRSGCRPNAVLRPVLCPRTSVPEEGASPNPQPKPPEEKEGTLGFAVFALRDLKAHEEVVLGWEWDDEHAIHQLPALIQTPGLFP